MTAEVRYATFADLTELSGLFDVYRQFYDQSSDLAAGRAFLADRLVNQDTVLLVASGRSRLLGFAHLFPSFSSISMTPAFILNDLFVEPEARGIGLGAALLDASVGHARAAGAASMSLSTARDNLGAQGLYERRGWAREERFVAYNLRIDMEDLFS